MIPLLHKDCFEFFWNLDKLDCANECKSLYSDMTACLFWLGLTQSDRRLRQNNKIGKNKLRVWGVASYIRDFTQTRRRRQRKRQIKKRLNELNNAVHMHYNF